MLLVKILHAKYCPNYAIVDDRVLNQNLQNKTRYLLNVLFKNAYILESDEINPNI